MTLADLMTGLARARLVQWTREQGPWTDDELRELADFDGLLLDLDAEEIASIRADADAWRRDVRSIAEVYTGRRCAVCGVYESHRNTGRACAVCRELLREPFPYPSPA